MKDAGFAGCHSFEACQKSQGRNLMSIQNDLGLKAGIGMRRKRRESQRMRVVNHVGWMKIGQIKLESEW